MPADLTIRNATVIDGSGSPGFAADVSVQEGRIVAVGEGLAATREVDGTGMVLSPGFVDTHCHDDGAFIRYPGMEFKVAQGVTTCVNGNCGFSSIPNIPGHTFMPGDIVGGRSDWTDLDSYFDACLAKSPAINSIMLAGHNRIRSYVIGLENRAPSADELAEMRALVERAMEQGACGFSTGLIYEPGRYSTTDELVALCSESGKHGGLYATHMRNEGDKLLEAVDEALHIAREAKTPLHISHHKSAGKRNWGRIGESLRRVDEANAGGMDVTLDIYPYTAGSGPMWQYVNLDQIDTEWAANVRIASCPDYREWEGKSVPEIASDHEWSIEEAVKEILTSPKGKEVVCIHFIIDEADIETNLRHPKVMIGSDGIPVLTGKPHPRLFGTMPRVLGHYVRDRKVITLEEAIRRMTSLSAERFGLASRGLVKEGYFADLVLFDAGMVRDTATYEEPQQEPEGIAMVVVNGQVAVEGGRHSGVGTGQMLRYRRES